VGAIVEFASNGKSAQGYLAVPESGQGPGVILIQEWWGLDRHCTDVSNRLAREGFVVLAPDLYHGEQASEPDEAEKIMMAMETERVARDLVGAVEFLASHPAVKGKGIGTIGFCMGGGLVLWLTTLSAKVIAAAPFYGVIPWENTQPDYSRSLAAYQGHYAEHDEWAPPEATVELESRLRGLGREAEFFIYPGTSHAFFNDERADHQPQAARLAWDRVLRFLREKLA
jgi:carboxymethylenebutenolidase